MRLDEVRIKQGTDSTPEFSSGNTLPLVSRPFGASGWVPQNQDLPGRRAGWFYSPRARKLRGIRCTHQANVWVGDFAHFSVLPQANEPVMSRTRRAASYRLDSEVLAPHHMSLFLPRWGCTLECAPTSHCALLRVRFPEGTTNRRLVIDALGPEDELAVDAERGIITGVLPVVDQGICPDAFRGYLVARLRQPATGGGVTEEDGLFAYLESDAAEMVMEIGLSYISHDQAMHNLAVEVGDRPFEALVDEGAAEWQAWLDRIETAGATDRQRQTLASCLYRALLFPTTVGEPAPGGGEHHRSPYDGEVHPGPMVTGNGFWDTYRTVYPLLALLAPSKCGEILQGWVNAGREGGWTPKWALPGYRGFMIGTHLDTVFADAWVKGIEGWDAEAAWEAVRRDAYEPGHPDNYYGRLGLAEYLELGHVPVEAVKKAASRTLDFAYNDWCAAVLADEFGTAEETAELRRRAGNWRNVVDPDTRWVRGRHADGAWVEPFDPRDWGGPYVEGSAWQCGWGVYHEPEAFIEALGGPDAVVERLDTMLATPGFRLGRYHWEEHEMSEMVAMDFGQYGHNNQPSHHVLYFYSLCGKPWKAQAALRRVMDELYDPSPTGFCGDEDNGEMASWYLLNALGIYPFCPGRPEYMLGTALAPRVELRMEGGRVWTLEAEGCGADRPYVGEMKLNGESWRGTKLPHETVAAGGTLKMIMQAEPPCA